MATEFRGPWRALAAPSSPVGYLRFLTLPRGEGILLLGERDLPGWLARRLESRGHVVERPGLCLGTIVDGAGQGRIVEIYHEVNRISGEWVRAHAVGRIWRWYPPRYREGFRIFLEKIVANRIYRGLIEAIGLDSLARERGLEEVIHHPADSFTANVLARHLELPRVRHPGAGRVRALPPMPVPVEEVDLPESPGRPGRKGVAAMSTLKPVHFDPERKGEFFWMLDSGIARDRLLFLLDRPDVGVDPGELGEIAGEGVGLLALREGARVEPARAVGREPLLLAKGMLSLVSRLLQGGLPVGVGRGLVLHSLFAFDYKFAWWRKLFEREGVGIHVNPVVFSEHHVPMTLALREAGGVSVAYQWSHLWFDSMVLACQVDVMFTFSPRYDGVWSRTRSKIDHLVDVGYITSSSFPGARKRALETRRQLEEAGCRKVVAFLDENSGEGLIAPIPDGRMREQVAFLLERLSGDPELGLVFKPGYPSTLRKRLGPVAELYDRALESGRLVVLEEGGFLTEAYPCEASLASDVSLCLLFGGTSQLESRLAGARVVLLDEERNPENPMRRDRPEKTHDTMESAWAEVQAVLDGDPGAGLGRDGELESCDPFQDEASHERLGSFLGELHRELESGATREEALESAITSYASTWGAERVRSGP